MSGERNNFVLYMFQQDIDDMESLVLQYPNKETGGDLFGLWSGEGDNAVIHVVLGPGRGCTHGDYHFYQDVNYLETVGRLLTENYMLGHIGEWHSHHQLRLDRPSDGDCRTIQRNYPQGSCGFFLMIANIACNSEGKVSFSPYIFKAGSRHGRRGKVQVIAERSPFTMVKPISKVINEGKEEELGKANGKLDDGKRKELIFFLPNTSTTVDTGSSEFSSNGLHRTQNSRTDFKEEGSRSTMMSAVYKVTLPPNSDHEWYSKEENRDILNSVYLGLCNLVGPVDVTFEKYNDMNMTFNHKGADMRLSFGSAFPFTSVKLYVRESYIYEGDFHLYKDNTFKSYDFSKFMKEIHDFLQKYPTHFI